MVPCSRRSPHSIFSRAISSSLVALALLQRRLGGQQCSGPAIGDSRQPTLMHMHTTGRLFE
jgi:hypothetical protein